MKTIKSLSAGAGTGKTWSICDEVARRVTDGIDPARILATTYTRKAAAELKGRVQARLLAEPSLDAGTRIAKAERLELASIGTVHSVAHRLLSRHALRLGMSPRLDVLDEGGTSRHLSLLLGEVATSAWEDLHELAGRLGQGDDVAASVLDLLEAKRSNQIGDEAFLRHIRDSAERVCSLLVPDGGPLMAGGVEVLRAAARSALSAVSAVSDSTDTTRKALDKLQRLAEGGSNRWATFLEASRVEAGKRSGADALLTPLRELGRSVRRRANLHEDLRAFSSALAQQVLALDAHYRAYKRERGLLDYTDLEVSLLGLLDDEELGYIVADGFDLVVVDEFQDTNPIQLAIFLRLAALVEESIWVGDPRQAIYGFRGSAPQLVEAAWTLVPERDRGTLTKSYRSQRGLVRLSAELFVPVLGEGVRLEAERPPAPRAVERWWLEPSVGRPNQERDAEAIAEGVVQLTSSGVALGDIAILVRRHSIAAQIASALRNRRVPVAVAEPGLLRRRESEMVIAGLRLVADRRDSLAAATVLHLLEDPTAPTPSWFAERLTAVRESSEGQPHLSPWPEHPLLKALERIDARIAEPVHVLVATIDALGLVRFLAEWGDADRRGGYVDALIGLAAAYQESARETGEACTLTGLIEHLEGLRERGEDEAPAPQGLDAITVSTYHAAKGLEWPVVVLAELDGAREPDVWGVQISGGRAEEGRPLKGRELRSWLWPFGRDQWGKLVTGSGLEADGLASPEGRARQAAERDERLRLLYVGFTRARDRVVLAHRRGSHDWLDLVPNHAQCLPSDLAPGEHRLESAETTLVVRRIDVCTLLAREVEPATVETWLDGPASALGSAPLRVMSPSAAISVSAPMVVSTHRLTGPGTVAMRFRSSNQEGVGRAVHSYLATLPSLRGAAHELRVRVATRCLHGFQVEGDLAPTDMIAIGERLEVWAQERYPNARWWTEAPVRGRRADGGWWVGTVDLVLVLPDGRAALVDHKTTAASEAGWTAVSEPHWGQLLAYREALGSAGLQVMNTWVHLALGGGLVELGDGA